ncbi:MAG: ATP-grasp domain-containing protein [Flavobacteriaceae bacterium]|nr:ATP-grasp domain-containing protein [Flavobacteriaceae bacterium]
MKKKLAVLGASYLQKPLIEKALALGVETHCFAWDKDAVCKEISDYFYPISVLEYDTILEKCKEISIDGITTIAMDICIPVVNKIAQQLHLVGNSDFCSITTTEKSRMKEVLKENRIPIAFYLETFQRNFTEDHDFIFPLIVKPVDRSGSLGVTIVNNYTELNNAVKVSCEYSFQKKSIIEQFIEGAEVSVETISYKGKHKVLAITDKKITKKPYFVEIEHHQPSQYDNVLQSEIIEIALRTLEATRVENGASHIEFIIDKERNVYVNEIGSRMGGDFIGSHLVQLSTGFDYVKAIIDIALGEFSMPKIVQNINHSGVYFLSQENPHLLKYFEEDYDFIVQKEITNSSLKPLKSSADRSGYIIYQSDRPIIL